MSINSSPTFSIITITLNNLSGLQKTYKSIKKQSLDDYEWIVVDGQSSDGSVDFLREIRSEKRSAQYPFNFISEPDDGIYDAMNKGTKLARGHYLLFLNAGDELAAPETLDMVHKKTEGKPDFIYGDALEPLKIGAKPSYKAAQHYKNIAWGMFTHHQAMFYRRHTVRDHKMHYSLRYKIASDYDFTARFLRVSKKVSYIRKPICIFEQGGISQVQAALGRKEQYLIRDALRMISIQRNVWIYLVQAITWRLRSLSPSLYQSMKVFIRGQKS